MQARLVGLSFSVETGHAAYLPLGARLSRRAGAAADGRGAGRAATRCSRTRPWPRSASTASTTCTCCAGTASRCAAMPRTRCWRASCSTPAASATTWIRWRRATWATTTIRYEDVAGKGAKQIAFAAGRAGAGHRLRRRGRRHHLRLHQRAVGAAGGRAGPAARVPRDRDAAGAGAGADGSQRRADRHGRAAPAERGPVAAHAARAAARARTRRPRLQPRFAQAAGRSCCSRN